MPPCDLRHHRAGSQRLLNDARLVIRREPAPATSARNNLQPAHRRWLRLKYMVKLRHKPISDSEISTMTCRKPQKKVGLEQRLPSMGRSSRTIGSGASIDHTSESKTAAPRGGRL